MDSIRFSIAKGKVTKNGFYFGLSYTENGQPYYPEYWSITERKDGSTILLLTSVVDDAGFAQHFRGRPITELTQDAFSIEWGNQSEVIRCQRAK